MAQMNITGWSKWSGEDVESVILGNGNLEIRFKDGSVILAIARCGYAAPTADRINKLEVKNLTGQGEVCEVVPKRQ